MLVCAFCMNSNMKEFDLVVDKTKEITLKRIFNIQEACYLRNRSIVPPACDFIEKCISLIMNRKIVGEGFSDEERRKFKIIHAMLDTALSSSINSYKLILYGCLGDAISLQRVIFEACVFIDYGIQFNAYYEIENKFILTIYEGKELVFKDILKKIEDKEKTDRGKLFGDLSNYGSHLSAQRLYGNYFELHGKKYPVMGHSLLSEERIRGALGFQMRVVLYLLNLIAEFYKEIKPEVLVDKFFIKAESLKKQYELLGNNGEKDVV